MLQSSLAYERLPWPGEKELNFSVGFSKFLVATRRFSGVWSERYSHAVPVWFFVFGHIICRAFENQEVTASRKEGL